MKQKIKKKQPSFLVKMFMDENDINEKSIVGFAAFIMMVICLGIDIYTGFYGMKFPINEFVFDDVGINALPTEVETPLLVTF